MIVEINVYREFELELVSGLRTWVELELPVSVKLYYTPASRGARDSFGASEEPDTEETFDVTWARNIEDGTEIELTKYEETLAIEAAINS